MAEGDPADNPFSNLPMFGDLAKALAGQGPLNWDAAKQFAGLAATGGTSETNVDPATRIALGELARIVELHVRDITAVDIAPPSVTTVTPGMWAQQTLDAYRPLFTELAVSLGRRPAIDDAGDASDDPMMAMMAGLSSMMAPSMMGMAIGSMIGRMAARTFGQYDLPIPRNDRTLLLVPAAIDQFAREWSLAVDEMRLWVLSQEITADTLFTLGTVRDDYAAMVRAHVGGFQPDPAAIADKLSSLDVDGDDPMQAFQRMLGDPAVMLGAVESPAQAELAPRLSAATAAIVGYVDYLVDSVAIRLIGGDALRIAEAVRRRRVEAGPDDIYIHRLLGLQIDAAQVQRGKVFIGGVADRVGEQSLSDWFSRPNALPTPAELDAPGLWVARLEL